MPTFFENINKNSVQLDVLHGWDISAKAWYIDIKMTGFSGSNIRELFSSEKIYKNTLKKFLV
tara:strand:- start:706 stop:891 length:186 start_codon:yes stop_codon:yes gene_type:complete